MGYHTDFEGAFQLSEPLTDEQREYLHKFCESRKMKRSTQKIALIEDDMSSHVLADLPIGREGEFYVDGKGFMGQDEDDTVLESNSAPDTQPGLWCQWQPGPDGDSIEWDGGEKFYGYTEWIEYIVENFLKPWGHTLNGEVHWSGEESGDLGVIIVEDNNVSTKAGVITYE